MSQAQDGGNQALFFFLKSIGTWDRLQRAGTWLDLSFVSHGLFNDLYSFFRQLTELRTLPRKMTMTMEKITTEFYSVLKWLL